MDIKSSWFIQRLTVAIFPLTLRYRCSPNIMQVKKKLFILNFLPTLSNKKKKINHFKTDYLYIDLNERKRIIQHRFSCK